MAGWAWQFGRVRRIFRDFRLLGYRWCIGCLGGRWTANVTLRGGYPFKRSFAANILEIGQIHVNASGTGTVTSTAFCISGLPPQCRLQKIEGQLLLRVALAELPRSVMYAGATDEGSKPLYRLKFFTTKSMNVFCDPAG